MRPFIKVTVVNNDGEERVNLFPVDTIDHVAQEIRAIDGVVFSALYIKKPATNALTRYRCLEGVYVIHSMLKGE